MTITFHNRGHGHSTKFWLLPDGQLHDTDGAYHYLWAQRHLSFLQEKYGITLNEALAKSTEEQPVRLALIQQKMVRVHHSGRRNLLTVEGTWQGLSEPVLRSLRTLITSQPDDITSVCVNCFNQSAESYDSAFANFVGCFDPKYRNTKIDALFKAIDSKTTLARETA